MERGDCGLHRERARPAAQRPLDKWKRFGNLLAVPSTAILLFQDDEIAVSVRPGIPPRIVEQHEGDKSDHLGRRLRSHESLHEATPSKVVGEIARTLVITYVLARLLISH
jgi:hypothetical protein